MEPPNATLYKPGELPEKTAPGSLCFTMRRAPLNYGIMLFQNLRYGYEVSWATHIEVVVDTELSSVGAVWPRVRQTSLREYEDWAFLLVEPHGSAQELQSLAQGAVEKIGTSYSILELGAAGLYLVTGLRPPWNLHDEVICSGFASRLMLDYLSAYSDLSTPAYLNSPAYILTRMRVQDVLG